MLLYIYIAPILLHDQVRGQKKFRCPCDNRKAKKKNTHLKLLTCPRVHWPCTGRLVNFVAPLELATTHNDKGPACLLAFFSGITAPRNDTKIELKRD